jgi:hypothetical protein
MSSNPKSFAEFCGRINSDSEYRSRYLEDPVSLIESDLGITNLSETQKGEIRDTVNKLLGAIPDVKLYISGQEFAPSGSGLQCH